MAPEEELFKAALAAREVWRIDLDNGKVVGEERLFSELNARLRDVRTGPDGLLYLLTDAAQGQVLRVLPKSTP